MWAAAWRKQAFAHLGRSIRHLRASDKAPSASPMSSLQRLLFAYSVALSPWAIAYGQTWQIMQILFSTKNDGIHKLYFNTRSPDSGMQAGRKLSKNLYYSVEQQNGIMEDILLLYWLGCSFYMYGQLGYS
jgi:hypothetical protein